MRARRFATDRDGEDPNADVSCVDDLTVLVAEEASSLENVILNAADTIYVAVMSRGLRVNPTTTRHVARKRNRFEKA